MPKLDENEIRFWAQHLLKTRVVPIFVRPAVNRAVEREYQRLLAERRRRRYRRKNRRNTWDEVEEWRRST